MPSNGASDAVTNVPSIAITSESTQNLADTHNPVDDFKLAPTPLSSRPRTSLDVPTSPITDDGSSVTIPPSPTLSNRSSVVHFKTTTDLRDSDPEHKSHFRKLSNATINSETTEMDAHHSDLVHKLSPESGVTAVQRQDASPSSPQGSDSTKRKFKRKKGKVDEDAGKTAHQIELEQDHNLDPRPFDLRPYQLAHSLDPKSFDTIAAFGGTSGVLGSLGTRAEHGLGKELLRSSTGQSLAEKEQVATPQRDRPSSERDNEKGDTVPAITLTSPEGPTSTESSSLESIEDGPAFHASMDDRRRVYGDNILPTRPSKTLLQLMWLAMKDKVLILLSIAAVISFALGLFQDFGTPRAPGEAPVDWVEGVAIMVAVSIVVCPTFLAMLAQALISTISIYR
jgi:Ca2+-transporting ATPase